MVDFSIYSAITAPNYTRLPNPLDMARTGLISKEVTCPNLRNPITKPKLPEDTYEFLEEKFSLQVWWKTHQQDYPILAIIAKQILGTPVSTVAVEQEFSAGGNILEPRRSVMSPQSLEMQACVDDWTKAKYRQQELQPEIVNDFFEDDQTTGTEGSD
ncbi:hypothetical protein LWI28_025746 [Acer negundo]|uniref:HAT C-terminal dimerisation domain-containing protein n=1 Tax=Acer negundo TaxID=4023 RepID=A0AAD5JUC9_ACENE|nr:hypothetical protein LWI28_025746 [Acer negundo]